MSRLAEVLAGRRTGSLLTGLSFLAVSVSGVLSFASAYTERLAGVHTVAGIAFIAAAAIHLVHNGMTWLRYVRGPKVALPSRSFVVAVLVSGALLAASVLQAAPVRHLLAWGSSLRDAGQPKKTTYETRTLDVHGDGPLLSIDLKAGPHFRFVEPSHGWLITPQIAVWTEDEQGQFLETLSVTRDEGRSGYDEGDEAHTLSPRPAALPVWAHALGVQHGATPLEDRHARVADIVSTASPEDNVYLVSRAHTRAARFAVLLEVNSSFDYNDYYRPDAFPGDVAYTEGGNPAQPSVVYRAIIEPGGPRFTLMEPIGHGHHAGADGRIDPDLSHLTTALDIVDRVVVEVVPPPS